MDPTLVVSHPRVITKSKRKLVSIFQQYPEFNSPAAQPENKMQRRVLLNRVVLERVALLELLVCEDVTLVRRGTVHALYFKRTH